MTDNSKESAPPDAQPTPIVDRINSYLATGGLWNPELANHDAVRDLLIDCRNELAGKEAEVAAANQVINKCAVQCFRCGGHGCLECNLTGLRPKYWDELKQAERRLAAVEAALHNAETLAATGAAATHIIELFRAALTTAQEGKS